MFRPSDRKPYCTTRTVPTRVPVSPKSFGYQILTTVYFWVLRLRDSRHTDPHPIPPKYPERPTTVRTGRTDPKETGSPGPTPSFVSGPDDVDTGVGDGLEDGERGGRRSLLRPIVTRRPDCHPTLPLSWDLLDLDG